MNMIVVLLLFIYFLNVSLVDTMSRQNNIRRYDGAAVKKQDAGSCLR